MTRSCWPWRPWSGNAKYPVGKSGLMVSVAVDSISAHGDVYALQLEAASEKAVDFVVTAGDKQYSGSVTSNQDSLVRIPGSHSGKTIVAQVTCKARGCEYGTSIFLPAFFDPKASAKNMTLAFENASVRQMLSRISKQYGVVLMARGGLDKVVSHVRVEGNPDEALRSCVAGTDANMKSRALESSIYAVEPAR